VDCSEFVAVLVQVLKPQFNYQCTGSSNSYYHYTAVNCDFQYFALVLLQVHYNPQLVPPIEKFAKART